VNGVVLPRRHQQVCAQNVVDFDEGNNEKMKKVRVKS